jgi:hypothetical protein
LDCASNAIKELVNSVLNGRCDKVSAIIAKTHLEFSSCFTFNYESDLTMAILISFIAANENYEPIREFTSGYGRADVCYLPNKGVSTPPMVIELKRNEDSSVALAQIIDKHYSDKLRGYKEVIALGINYDEKDKNYTA